MINLLLVQKLHAILELQQGYVLFSYGVGKMAEKNSSKNNNSSLAKMVPSVPMQLPHK
jgi:hypothetical protein